MQGIPRTLTELDGIIKVLLQGYVATQNIIKRLTQGVLELPAQMQQQSIEVVKSG